MFEHDVRCGLQLAQMFNNRIPLEWYDIPPIMLSVGGWMDWVYHVEKYLFVLDKSYPIIDFLKSLHFFRMLLTSL